MERSSYISFFLTSNESWPTDSWYIYYWFNTKKIYLICATNTNPNVSWSRANAFIIQQNKLSFFIVRFIQCSYIIQRSSMIKSGALFGGHGARAAFDEKARLLSGKNGMNYSKVRTTDGFAINACCLPRRFSISRRLRGGDELGHRATNCSGPTINTIRRRRRTRNDERLHCCVLTNPTCTCIHAINVLQEGQSTNKCSIYEDRKF